MFIDQKEHMKYFNDLCKNRKIFISIRQYGLQYNRRSE